KTGTRPAGPACPSRLPPPRWGARRAPPRWGGAWPRPPRGGAPARGGGSPASNSRKTGRLDMGCVTSWQGPGDSPVIAEHLPAVGRGGGEPGGGAGAVAHALDAAVTQQHLRHPAAEALRHRTVALAVRRPPN